MRTGVQLKRQIVQHSSLLSGRRRCVLVSMLNTAAALQPCVQLQLVHRREFNVMVLYHESCHPNEHQEAVPPQ